LPIAILATAAIAAKNSLFPKEITPEEWLDFNIAVQNENNATQIQLTGLLANSAMGITASDIQIAPDGGTVNITLYQRLAKQKYSGALNKTISVQGQPKHITYGSAQKTIWQAPPEPAQP
jgi:MSHA biogenesis protein mshE